jgi:PAS domain S-box-containing protein
MEKARILIVEDEAIIAMELENQLQSLGYNVTSIVDTGVKAIEKAEKDKPDLILMDIRIKGEMDGIETAEVIRKRFAIPVIFSTAYLDEIRIERAKITMPFGYVLKPIQERDLKVTMEMALYVSKVDNERRKAETTLHFEKNLAQQYLNVAGVLLVALDTKGNVTLINPKGCEILGFKKEEIVGYNWFEKFLPQDSNEEVKKVFNQIIKGNVEPMEYYENPISRKNGSQRFVAWHNSVLHNSSGEIIGLFSSGEDITERNQTEQELIEHRDKLEELVKDRTEELNSLNEQLEQKVEALQQKETELTESEERFRDLFENAPLPYQSLNESGQIIEVNEAWLHELGYKKDEVVGKNIVDFLPSDFQSVFNKQFPEFKKNGYLFNADFKLKCKDGTLKDASFNGKIGNDKAGNFKQTHCVFTPINK